MAHLVNDVKEKLEISWRTIDILEKTIEVICGDAHPEEAEKEGPQKKDSVFRDMDILTQNMLRILNDVEVLKALVTGNETNCNPE